MRRDTPHGPDVTTEERPEEREGESFLGRWSRRKHEALQPAPPPVDDPAAESAPGEPEEKPVLTDADMPPLETLDENSDFSGFLSPGVSEKLRRLALRKLFHGAGFNIRDGLNEYDEDYTQFEPLGDVVTSDMRHQMEMEARRAREAAERALGEGEPAQTDQVEAPAGDGQELAAAAPAEAAPAEDSGEAPAEGDDADDQERGGSHG